MLDAENDKTIALYRKQRKRKAISVTSRLQRFDIRMLAIGLILFSVISIYPIINFTTTDDFIKE